MSSKSFLQAAVDCEIINPYNTINDYVEQWHNDPNIEKSLYEFLGLSWEEYSLWVENPLAIIFIVENHQIDQWNLESAQEQAKIKAAIEEAYAEDRAAWEYSLEDQ